MRVVFNDTSVLINFHRAGRLGLLHHVFGQQLTWVDSVRYECIRKGALLDMPDLESTCRGLLGEPLRPENAEEHRRIRLLRAQMAEPGDHPEEHLGEAETITLISMRGLDAVVLTDDQQAARMSEPSPVLSTWSVLRLGIRLGRVSVDEAVEVWEQFCHAGGHPPRKVRTRDALIAYLRPGENSD